MRCDEHDVLKSKAICPKCYNANMDALKRFRAKNKDLEAQLKERTHERDTARLEAGQQKVQAGRNHDELTALELDKYMQLATLTQERDTWKELVLVEVCDECPANAICEGSCGDAKTAWATAKAEVK